MKDDFDLNEFGEEDFCEEHPTIVMYEDDGTETEFCVISSVENEGINYLLVIESSLIDDDEAEAVILKEVMGEGDEAFFEIVEDDEEFEKCVAIFKNCNDDYDIEV